MGRLLLKISITVSVLLFQISVLTPVEGARILVVFPPPAPSHFILGSALVKELVNRGHELTFISSFGIKEEKNNLRNIILKEFVQNDEDKKQMFLNIQNSSTINQFSQMINMTRQLTELTLKNADVQKLLSSKDEHFDLVIMETFLSEAHVVFAHHFNCPLIVFSTIGSNNWVNYLVGNEAPPSYVPQMIGGLSNNMNFWERVTNFLLTYSVSFLYSWYHLPYQNKIVHTYFPSAPPLDNIIQERVALVLLNSHPSISPARPSVPNMIEIGGFHISETKSLPKNLKKYLDEAKQGFILFSLGSNFKSTMLSTETLDEIMKVFAQLPYKILWKFEDDQLPGKPDNVQIDKWLPQNDILAHPNIKLFITHGGLLSTTEAVYHGVPLLGIPIFGDQKMNMASAEKLGIGKAINLNEITSENLLSAIQDLLNKKYREAAKKRSALFRDQPIRPIDSAVYWVEYILRHKYSEHLKTGATNLSWYQIQSLDVLLFLGSVIFTTVFILYLGIKICCKCIRKKQEKKKIQ